MKKLIVLSVLVFLSAATQANAQLIKAAPKKVVDGWQNKSFESDGVYGAEVDRAYELLEGKKAKKTAVVAIIGPGIDVANKDIADVLWKNRKEKSNGKDDDRNKLVDDIHGWNFLGGPNGEVLNAISREGDREFFRLKDKYVDMYKNDGRFYTIDEVENRLVEVTQPVDEAEYRYFKGEVLPESPIGRTYAGMRMVALVKTYMPEFDAKIRAVYPDKKTFTQRDFQQGVIDRNEQDTLRAIAMVVANFAFMSAGDDWDATRDFIMSKHMALMRESYDKALQRLVRGEREVVGDDPMNIGDAAYGNSNLMAGNAGQGTMQAGLIGAKRGVGNGVEGVTNNVRIMTLRTEADAEGEPYMKDVALAIRYAVDHGADVIQLGKTNTLYPQEQSQWVDEALIYARDKGVFVVVPAMDYSFNLDEEPFYPNRFIGGQALDNMIMVAASDANGNPAMKASFSNKALDLFAPGVNVRSTFLGNTNRTESGSNLAASMVAGVAALIKSYYPRITPEQMRALLMENITSREGAEVEKEFYMYDNGSRGALAKDLFLFEDLSVAPGILNARKALEAAGKLSK